ncbi:MAG: peptidoglycan DD-metalloendopeptidase family protein [Actinomycetota bacterium]|nr:peptidoglycan DD-metalloendopeptidase family protein [Actinomycetota bacterium]
MDGLIERHFDAPENEFGPGHRGIDYAVSAGTRVRAAGPGVVTWAGPVAGRLAVTIDHGDGLETTYSILSALEVTRGDVVDEGRWIGTTGSAHPEAAGGLHFGVKLHDHYVDPLAFLGPADLSGAIHLAPLIESETDLPEALHLAHEGAGAAARTCRDPAPVGRPPPPNDNIAVAIGGLSSSTANGTDAAILERATGPWALGYPESRVYRFSYRGPKGADLHEPYAAQDTWRDLNASTLLLRRLLLKIARRHPGVDVDLFGHSQGGLVARNFVERLAQTFDPRLPRIENVVTFGTPHTGTSLADVPAELATETITGPFAVDELSDRARQGESAVDPQAPSVAQMRPDSTFMANLAREDVSYGTRVLALAAPHDLIVPAHNALWPGEDSRVLSPASWNGHREAVASAEAKALAYAFLRRAPASCPGNWDEWGPLLSRGVSFAHGLVADAYFELETIGLGKVYRALKWTAGKAGGVLDWMGERAKTVASWAVDRARDLGDKASGAARWVGGKLSGVGRFVRSGVARMW